MSSGSKHWDRVRGASVCWDQPLWKERGGSSIRQTMVPIGKKQLCIAGHCIKMFEPVVHTRTSGGSWKNIYLNCVPNTVCIYDGKNWKVAWKKSMSTERQHEAGPRIPQTIWQELWSENCLLALSRFGPNGWATVLPPLRHWIQLLQEGRCLRWGRAAHAAEATLKELTIESVCCPHTFLDVGSEQCPSIPYLAHPSPPQVSESRTPTREKLWIGCEAEVWVWLFWTYSCLKVRLHYPNETVVRAKIRDTVRR